MKEKFVVTNTESGQRIDALCAQKFPKVSRSQWQKYGIFVCEKKECPGKTKVREGEKWEVSYDEEANSNSHLQEWDMSLHILAESKTWVVIEKPAGISVHPSTSDSSHHTIVNALVHQFGKKKLSDDTERPGIVHRLDKVTSGVLLIAKTNATHRYLQEHWKDVEKVYYALVQGTPPLKGRVEAGIFRDMRDRKKMAVSLHEKSRDAVTHFERLSTQNNISLLKIKIPTGRTHQIRVHLSSIGFPILGDEKYGGTSAERVFLHAQSLSFPDPDQKGKKIMVESLLPKEFWKEN